MIKALRARMTRGGADGADLPPLSVPIALVTIGAAMFWFCYWGRDLHRFIQWVAAYIGLFIGHMAMYAVACWVVMRGGGRGGESRAVRLLTLGVVVLFAILFRVTLSMERPYLSSDIYRYIWDGRVQAAGINPYQYPPDAEELNSLRDDKIFRNINPGDLKWLSPYPPLAQAIYFAVYSIRPSSFIAFKLAMSLFDIITILALMLTLARSRIDPARAIIFAWHPIPIYEGAHSGHIEAAYIAFLALALLSRAHRKHALTGVMLALAVLVKFYPVLLLPAFLAVKPAPLTGHGREKTTRLKNNLGLRDKLSLRDKLGLRIKPTVVWLLSRIRGLFNKENLRMLVAFVVTILFAYLPYIGSGTNMFWFLRGYIEEEGFIDAGTRYYLFAVARALVPFPTVVFLIIAAGALGLTALWWMMRVKRDATDVARGAMSLVGLYLILTTPRYSWYYAWLVPYLCFVPRIGWLYLASASALLYLLWYTPLVYPDIPLWLGAVIYFPALAWLVLEGKRERIKDER